MDDLARWLGEQLSIDAAKARETADEYGAVWTVDDAMESVRGDTGADVLDEPGAPRAYIAEWDPARVLREIDADRVLLVQYERLKYEVMPDDMTGVFALEAVLRAKAAVYADRPGYREEWAPTA